MPIHSNPFRNRNEKNQPAVGSRRAGLPNRREFITAAAGVAAVGALSGLSIAAPASSRADAGPGTRASSDAQSYADLLKIWCDGLLGQLITDKDPKLNGALRCPACGVIHGRCHDALYPMMHMARATGDAKYLDAAVKLQAWSDNVTLPTGEFTNDLDPGSWKGITVFAAIALADALHHHGELLDAATRVRWRDRLSRAVKFLDGWMTLETGNINYPLTSALAFTAAGQVLGEQHYLDRGREFAQHALEYFTANNLLFGENHPATALTAKHCRAVDIGYNVEETLPALALYALRTKDQPVLDAVVKSLQAHMQLMLPDGAWDNSWGSRMFKWTWWGSRTSDGCFPAYALLSDRDARFAEVARRNLALMRACTSDGLLYGGPHLKLNGDRPCVHHTFTHAKSLATVLDSGGPTVAAGEAQLARDHASGIIRFPEISTRLISVGPWRATLTDYDLVYYKSQTGHPTGGALSLLYHMVMGPICVSSMTEYALVEANNMQKHGDYPTMPLTPRVELILDNQTYTSLSDNEATVDEPAGIDGAFRARGRLLTASDRKPTPTTAMYDISYSITEKNVRMTASISKGTGARLIVPVVSGSNEPFDRVDANKVQIRKLGGVLTVSSTAAGALELLPKRVFNLVPGMQCLVFTVPMTGEQSETIEISKAE